ncbi:hypothetical protein [Hyphomonas beringensis]|nr:hypothetical protein [Hyphomonas beringensis]
MIRTTVTAMIVALAAQGAMADAMTAADIKRCKAMQATLAPKAAEIEEMKAKRDELAVVVETRGEAWEDAETLRLASAGHAAKADEAKQAYEAGKKQLMQSEQALQATVRQLNQDIAAYNQTCSTEE